MSTNNKQAKNIHVIEVSKLGYGYSVTHRHNGKLMFTATYEKEMEALRTAAIIGTAEEDQGHEVTVNINYNRRPGAA